MRTTLKSLNRALRAGPMRKRQPRAKPFRVKAKPMGLPPGLDYASISTLLDQLDGPKRG